MSTFINIHTLISHPSSMMNRDDAGLQKTGIFGGATRSRVSSQCLKRAIRQSDLYKEAVEEVSLRTNKADQLIDTCVEALPEYDRADIEAVVLAIGPKCKKEKDKETGETTRLFETVQPYSIGAIRESLERVKAGMDLKELKKYPLLPTLDVALSGRMDAGCPERNLEAAMSVAHSLTTHKADIEVDWFTACDDLAEQGSGHIGTQEFSAGVFYRYAAINLDLLATNLQKTKEDASAVIQTLLACFATVTPSGKEKTFAPYTSAEFVLCTRSNQPLSLANAFRKPVPNTGDVMEVSIQELVSHYESLLSAYKFDSEARALDLTKTADSGQIRFVDSLGELAFDLKA